MHTRFPATTMPDNDWWATLWPQPDATLRQLGIQPHMTVLDLCCGDGYFTAPLAKLVDGRVYALDLDPEMLKQAKAEAARQGVSVRQWLCADARDVSSMLPAPVDYVLMANTFHGVPDQAGLARTVRATLKPQGFFGLINWLPLPREQTTVLGRARGPATAMRISADALKTIVEPQGFRADQLINLPPYHYGMVFQAL